MKKYIYPILAFAGLVPAVADAQLNQLRDVNDLTLRLASIGDVVVYLLVALAVIYIVWAVVQYMIKGQTGDESRRVAGMHILWGIVGLALIISIWGLVNVLLGTFSTDNTAPTGDFPQTNFISQPGTSQPTSDENTPG